MKLEFERIYRAADYREALVSLLPAGPFWARQLSDPDSDLNAWLDWRSVTVQSQNNQISGKLAEGYPWRADNTLRQWEELAGLDPGTQTIAERRLALFFWRMGQLPTFSAYQKIVTDAGMHLIRIEQAHQPFTMNRPVIAPLYSRKDSNRRRFVVDPKGEVVRPPAYESGYHMNDNTNKPLFGVNDWVLYAPTAPADLAEKLQKIAPLPYVVEVQYLIRRKYGER